MDFIPDCPEQFAKSIVRRCFKFTNRLFWVPPPLFLSTSPSQMNGPVGRLGLGSLGCLMTWGFDSVDNLAAESKSRALKAEL